MRCARSRMFGSARYQQSSKLRYAAKEGGGHVAAQSTRRAACNMQHATCSTQRATHKGQNAQPTCADPLHEAFNTQHATCSMQHATSNATRSMQHATTQCNMQHITNSTQHTTCLKQKQFDHVVVAQTTCNHQRSPAGSATMRVLKRYSGGAIRRRRPCRSEPKRCWAWAGLG